MSYNTDLEDLGTVQPNQRRIGHAVLHNNISRLLFTIQTVIGVAGSTDPQSLEYRKRDKSDSYSKGEINFFLNLKQSLSEKGQPDGYAPLGSNGKIPYIFFPQGVGLGDLLSFNNLSELTNFETARTNLDVYGKTETYTQDEINTALSFKQNNLGYTAENIANKGQPSGYASLGVDGKIPSSQMPSISISEFLGNFVDTTTALANTGVQSSQRGDWFTVDTNGGESYMVINDNPTLITDINKFKTPTAGVSSVNGQTGAVVLTTDNINEGSTKFYLTLLSQNITGIKTFLSFPITPSSAPTSNYEVANKKYVDDGLALKLSLSGGTLTGVLKQAKSTNIASASVTDLNTATGNAVHVTGTTSINSFGVLPAGSKFTIIFDGILTLTHNATSLILPTGANIITAVGDSCEIISEGSGNWRVISYTRADGYPIKTSTSIITLIAGENLSSGDIVYQSIDGKVYKTDSSNLSKIKIKGSIIVGGTTNTSVTISTNIATLGQQLITGALYYLTTTGTNIFLYTNSYFDLSSQGTNNRGISISADGYTMFILSTNSNRVYQYSLSIKNNPTSATYSGKSFLTTGQSSNPNGLGFSDDGTKMYIGADPSKIYQYTLSTAWDVSTATYANKSYSYLSQCSYVIGAILFKPDGSKMYIKDYSGNAIYQYTLNTAWDVSTATYVQSISLTTIDTDGNGMYITKDGTSIYFIGITNDKIFKLNLSTARDISTYSNSGIGLSVASQETGGECIWINEDIGIIGINIIGGVNNKIYNYNYISSLSNGGVSTIQYGAYSKIAGQAINSTQLLLDFTENISTSISLINNTNYVATTKGFVVATGNYASGGSTITGTINGVGIAYVKDSGYSTAERCFLFFPVGYGQTYNVNASAGLERGYFIPLA